MSFVIFKKKLLFLLVPHFPSTISPLYSLDYKPLLDIQGAKTELSGWVSLLIGNQVIPSNQFHRKLAHDPAASDPELI